MRPSATAPRDGISFLCAWQVNFAKARFHATTELICLMKMSARHYTIGGERVCAPTLKKMMERGEVGADALMHEPASSDQDAAFSRSAKEIMEGYENSMRAARDSVCGCPGWVAFKELPTFDEGTPCWCWMFCGDRQGPFSLRELRTWIQNSEFPSEGMVFHMDRPGCYIRLHDACFYFGLNELASKWIDFDSQHSGGAVTGGKDVKDRPLHGGGASASERRCEQQPPPGPSGGASKGAAEMFDAVKFIKSLPQPRCPGRLENRHAGSVASTSTFERDGKKGPAEDGASGSGEGPHRMPWPQRHATRASVEGCEASAKEAAKHAMKLDAEPAISNGDISGIRTANGELSGPKRKPEQNGQPVCTAPWNVMADEQKHMNGCILAQDTTSLKLKTPSRPRSAPSQLQRLLPENASPQKLVKSPDRNVLRRQELGNSQPMGNSEEGTDAQYCKRSVQVLKRKLDASSQMECSPQRWHAKLAKMEGRPTSKEHWRQGLGWEEDKPSRAGSTVGGFTRAAKFDSIKACMAADEEAHAPDCVAPLPQADRQLDGKGRPGTMGLSDQQPRDGADATQPKEQPKTEVLSYPGFTKPSGKRKFGVTRRRSLASPSRLSGAAALSTSSAEMGRKSMAKNNRLNGFSTGSKNERQLLKSPPASDRQDRCRRRLVRSGDMPSGCSIKPAASQSERSQGNWRSTRGERAGDRFQASCMHLDVQMGNVTVVAPDESQTPGKVRGLQGTRTRENASKGQLGGGKSCRPSPQGPGSSHTPYVELDVTVGEVATQEASLVDGGDRCQGADAQSSASESSEEPPADIYWLMVRLEGVVSSFKDSNLAKETVVSTPHGCIGQKPVETKESLLGPPDGMECAARSSQDQEADEKAVIATFCVEQNGTVAVKFEAQDNRMSTPKRLAACTGGSPGMENVPAINPCLLDGTSIGVQHGGVAIAADEPGESIPTALGDDAIIGKAENQTDGEGGSQRPNFSIQAKDGRLGHLQNVPAYTPLLAHQESSDLRDAPSSLATSTLRCKKNSTSRALSASQDANQTASTVTATCSGSISVGTVAQSQTNDRRQASSSQGHRSPKKLPFRETIVAQKGGGAQLSEGEDSDCLSDVVLAQRVPREKRPVLKGSMVQRITVEKVKKAKKRTATGKGKKVHIAPDSVSRQASDTELQDTHAKRAKLTCSRGKSVAMLRKALAKMKRMKQTTVMLPHETHAEGRPSKDQGAPTTMKRSRALRNETRQMARSELMSDAVKWKNIKARSCFKNLRMGMSGVHSRGVFATEIIEPEMFVIEYTGVLIRASVAEIREKRYESEGRDSSYLFRLDDEWVVDATDTGGIARFINHSCEPNCYTKIITVEGQKKIAIYSRCTIRPGEELFYDYKFDYESEDKRVVCNCGAKTCRGYMN
ncbi:unnamed protein product [Ostreobium quekettii]|uniref:[histone H3]-lysine(4) N-trimethyltransferase n=1 Tax=Ostreobium quekettii TaxID=121088 RepID=A0A8S1IYZ9_9CHLO|nr:unnamed protein product [Ostreobium quekettii]